MRVVVTGLGAVGGFGAGAAALGDALYAGRTAFGASAPACDALPALEPRLAAAVGKFPDAELLGAKGLRQLSRESRLFLVAAIQAMREAGLGGDVRADDVGVFVGTRDGSLDEYMRFALERLTFGLKRLSPARGPLTGWNTPASQTSIRLKLGGPNLTVASRGVSGLDAIGLAAQWLRRGRARAIVVGGVDELGHFAARAQAPAASAPRPFDVARDGAVPGEGAAALILETEDSARARGARILATVEGWAGAFEPSRLDRAAARAIAGTGARVDAVFAAASGDRALDAAEAAGLDVALGGARPPVTAIKGCLGDWDGAAPAVAAVAAVTALGRGLVPPTVGHEQIDPALPALAVTREPVRRALGRVLVHALDAAGRASALVLGAA